MELDEKAEEALETLWIKTLEERRGSLPLEELNQVREGIVGQLLERGYIASSEGGLTLTEKGRLRAEDVVRRHRLAERLLADVLAAGDEVIHQAACQFEHLLDRDLDENICSLLGHPKVCPHGKFIPPGRCCQEGQREPKQVVSPLSQMAPGQRGRIAYIHAPQSGELQKLMGMGVLPGVPIALVQRFPSYVFQMRQAQFAVDREMADAIYVRLAQPGVGLRGGPGHRRGLWRRLRRQGRRAGPASS